MTELQQTTSQLQRDAEELAAMLAQHPDTWVDVASWIRTHTVSAAYVRAQYLAARERHGAAAEPAPSTPVPAAPTPVPAAPTPAPVPPAPSATDYGTGEEALVKYLTEVGPRPYESKSILARQFDVSMICVREACRALRVRVPETLPRRRKDS